MSAPETPSRVDAMCPADAARLDRDGYLLMRGAIPPAWVEALRAAFDAGELANDQWPVPRGAGWRHALVDLDPAVRRVCRLPALLAAVGHLLDGPFFLAQVEGREPRAGGGAQGLHRDGDDPPQTRIISALAFLDPFGPHNGATEVVAGTHRGEGLKAPPLAPHANAKVLAGEPGDVLLLDVNVLHGATRNVGGARRRSLLITYAAQALWADFERTRALRAVRMATDELFEPCAQDG
jgi:hypothetical protein